MTWLRRVSAAGIITTIAGTSGVAGYGGDGGPATASLLKNPSGIAVDAAGNVYIADVDNFRIRKINTAGIIITIAGNGIAAYSGDGGPATAAELSSGGDLAIDAGGNMYLADLARNTIRKINTAGIITTIAGNGTPGNDGDGGAATSARLTLPGSMAIDAAGNLYAGSVNRIRKINAAGIISTAVGNGTTGYSGDGGPATAAQLGGFSSVALDAVGNLYLAEGNNNVVRKVNTGHVGISETAAVLSASMYPNPASGTCTLLLAEVSGEAVITIANAAGRQVMSCTQAVTGNKTSIDIHSLQPGMYTVKAQCGAVAYDTKLTVN